MLRFLTPGKLVLGAAAALAAAVAVGLLIPDDEHFLYLVDEPHLVEPAVEVQGGEPHDERGALYFVDVVLRRPSLLESWLPEVFHDGASLAPAHAVNPTGLSDEARRESSIRVMQRSQQVAAAVAFEAVGEDVDMREDGAFVASVLPDTPAARVLRQADVIVGVDGEPVTTLDELAELLQPRKPGDRVEVAVRRGEEQLSFSIRLVPHRDDASRGAIGVSVEPSVSVDLPREVEFDTGRIGGPSAGLAFALGVLDELGRDVDRGLRVAVTGSLSPDGSVGAVGGVKQKTIGARDAGVDIFLVPAGDNAAEARRYADGMRVEPVESFQQALRVLATAAENG